MGLNFDSMQANKKLRDALMNAQNTDELNEVFLKARRERIARPGEQLELFPTVWKRTQEQEEAAADVLRWAETYGVYVPDGCDALMDRARRYADSHAKRLRAILKRAKLTEQEQAEILADYRAAAHGVTHYTAAPSLMAKAVRELSPRACYMEDKFLFYVMVFTGYDERVTALASYQRIKDYEPEHRAALTACRLWGPLADAWAWCINYGFADLAELSDPLADPLEFVGDARTFGDWWRYYRFYWFAKNALMATQEELESVTKPTFPIDEQPRFAFEVAELRACLSDFDTENALAADTLTGDGVTGAISRPLAALGSGGLVEYRLKENGMIGTNLLSLLKVKQERGEIPGIIYTTVEQALKGVNVYFAANRFRLEKGDRQDTLVLNTTFTDFARQCGYKDRESNQKNREQLRAAMSLLNAVQLSPRVYERSPVVFIYRQDKSKNDFLEIRVLPEYIQGPNRLLINAAQADKLKALGSRSGVELRFYCVTLTRGHKREEDILKQIYNYDAELDDAKRKDEEARQKGQEARNVWKFGENWRKHYKGKQGKLARFFAEAQACGALYWYESREGKDGKVYRWDKEAKKDTRTETGTEAEN